MADGFLHYIIGVTNKRSDFIHSLLHVSRTSESWNNNTSYGTPGTTSYSSFNIMVIVDMTDCKCIIKYFIFHLINVKDTLLNVSRLR